MARRNAPSRKTSDRRPEDWFPPVRPTGSVGTSDLDLKADKVTQVIAGAGLTGGGTLAADRTFNIGAGTGITVNADDVAIDTTAEAERIRDVMGAALVAGTNITITVNDGADTITIDAAGGSGSDESVQDAMATAFAAGSHTGITVTYNDGANSFDLASTITQYTDELVRDVIGAALVAGSRISITVNDGADTITIAAKQYKSYDFFTPIPTAGFFDVNINSTSYATTQIRMYMDFDLFVPTHYRILGRGASLEAGQTVDMQMTDGSGNPLHTGGNDVTGLTSTNTTFDTNWITYDLALTGMHKLLLRMKGSTATNDFRAVEIMSIQFKN